MRGSGVGGGLGCPFGGDARQWPPVPRLWPGATVVILASGPSLSDAQVERVRQAHAEGRCKVVVVNTTYERAPWAELLYACDAKWWSRYRPDFAGLKVSQDTVEDIPNVVRAPSVDEPGLSLDPLRIHQGANSGFQALNLAVLLGGRLIVLLGFDMKPGAGGKRHWHGDHPEGLSNPDAGNFARWRDAFAEAVPDLVRAGVEVVNCTPGSALACLPFADLEGVL